MILSNKKSLLLKWPNNYGFGDIFASIYSFENYGRQTGFKTYFCGHSLMKEVIDYFQLAYVSWEADESGAIPVDLIHQQQRLKFNDRKCHHWITSIYSFLTSYDLKHAKPLSLKSGMTQREGKAVLMQFDGASARGVNDNRYGNGLSSAEITHILSRLTNGESLSVIGGPNTKNYMGKNYEYRLGNIEFIMRELLNSNYFLGCDSGISHVAGCLGVPSKVIILCGYQCIKKYYDSYPMTECFRRDLTND